MVNQVAGLEGVGEGDPSQVSKGQHEAEALRRYVHRSQDGRLHPNSIQHVDCMKHAHQQQGHAHMPCLRIPTPALPSPLYIVILARIARHNS